MLTVPVSRFSRLLAYSRRQRDADNFTVTHHTNDRLCLLSLEYHNICAFRMKKSLCQVSNMKFKHKNSNPV